MDNTFSLTHRIRYTSKLGEPRLFYVKAANVHSAVLDFQLRTGNDKDCVTSVEAMVEHKWVKAW